MLIRSLHQCPEFEAGDKSLLRELLHPDKQEAAIRYSLAHATIKPGQTTLKHKLKTSEVYYILQGQGRMIINQESREVQKADTVYIAPQSVQSIANTGSGDLKFLCIVDPAWRSDDEQVLT